MIDSIIDLSHWNGPNVDLATAARDGGIIGVIQKASEGTLGIDDTYVRNRGKARTAGLLWGAYHYGTREDGTKQADHFIRTANLQDGELAVLDFEESFENKTVDGKKVQVPIPSMTLEQARAFVNYVHDKTGRLPVLYGGEYLRRMLGSQTDSVLGSCALWIAAYVRQPVIPPNWRVWTLWQWTDGVQGVNPVRTPGVTTNCDRSRFEGTADELRAFWRGSASNAGANDAGASDAGTSDGGASDAGASDAGASDSGASDGETPDAGVQDADRPIAGVP